MKKGIKQAKAVYRKKTEDDFSNRDPARMWQGIQHITNYRGNEQPIPDDNIHLAGELNHFFAHFGTTRTDNGIATPLDAVADPL